MLGDLFSDVIDSVSGLFGDATEAVTDTASSLTDAATDAVTDTASSLTDTATDAVTDAATSTMEPGGSLIDGLSSGSDEFSGIGVADYLTPGDPELASASDLRENTSLLGDTRSWLERNRSTIGQAVNGARRALTSSGAATSPSGVTAASNARNGIADVRMPQNEPARQSNPAAFAAPQLYDPSAAMDRWLARMQQFSSGK